MPKTGTIPDRVNPLQYASPLGIQSICFLGAESTGKSTLSIALAKRLNTVFVEEYGRTLWVEKDGDLTFDDYLRIATTHIAMEDAAKHVANHYVFVDTTPLTTLFYAIKHYEKADDRLSALSHRVYDHTFLCHPDFPLVQDGWRGDEDFRRAQHQWYVNELSERRIDYTDLTGTLNEKIETVVSTLALATLSLSAS